MYLAQTVVAFKPSTFENKDHKNHLFMITIGTNKCFIVILISKIVCFSISINRGLPMSNDTELSSKTFTSCR